MKTIEPIQIWDNGEVKTATILNAYAISVTLNQNALFIYSLYSANYDAALNNVVSSGQLYMDDAQYSKWTTDDFAWDFIANSLNLTITGDYTPPQIIEQPIENNPESL